MDMNRFLRKARRGFPWFICYVWGSKTRVKICFCGDLAQRMSVEIQFCHSALDPVCSLHLCTEYSWTHSP